MGTVISTTTYCGQSCYSVSFAFNLSEVISVTIAVNSRKYLLGLYAANGPGGCSPEVAGEEGGAMAFCAALSAQVQSHQLSPFDPELAKERCVGATISACPSRAA